MNQISSDVSKILKTFENIKVNEENIKALCDLIERLNKMRKENEYVVKDKVNFKSGSGAFLNLN